MAIRKTNIYNKLVAFDGLKYKKNYVNRFKKISSTSSDEDIEKLINTLNWLKEKDLIQVGIVLIEQSYPKDQLFMIHNYLISEENVLDLIDFEMLKQYPDYYSHLEINTFIHCLVSKVSEDIMKNNDNKKCFYISTYWNCIKKHKDLLLLAKHPQVKKPALAKQVNFYCR